MRAIKEFKDLMSLATGFRGAKILMVAVELGFFAHLEEPQTVGEVAAATGTHPRSAGILLPALAALGLVRQEPDGRFVNQEVASRFLVPGKENYRGAIIKHLHHTWEGWTALADTMVRGYASTTSTEKWVDRNKEGDNVMTREFIWGMDALARDLAPQVVEKLNLKGVRRLLDLGGGPATYAIAFVQATPGLKATVFDLPGPVAIARENISRHGLSERIHTLAGDFLQDEIGSDYDFIWVSQILHSHDEDQCRLLLAKAVKALNPGGRLAIQDFFLNDDGCSPLEAALFSVHMLAVTPRGRSYRHQEVAAWLTEMGLIDPVHLPTSPQTSVLVARKP